MLTTFIVVLVRMVMIVFLAARDSDKSVLVPRHPRIHVDFESRRGHPVAYRILHAHS